MCYPLKIKTIIIIIIIIVIIIIIIIINLMQTHFFPYHKGLLLNERIRSLWEQILSFKRSPYFERDAIDENHCSLQ